MKNRFKSAFSSRGEIPYLEGLNIIFEVKKTFGRSLNPPATMDDTTAQRIADTIAAYFVKIRSLNDDINDTVNSVEIFTACIVTKLATGLTLKGVPLIPKIGFFAQHTPEEVRFPGSVCGVFPDTMWRVMLTKTHVLVFQLQFKAIPSIRCRTMSIFTRSIHDACLTPRGNVRMDCRFNLS